MSSFRVGENPFRALNVQLQRVNNMSDEELGRLLEQIEVDEDGIPLGLPTESATLPTATYGGDKVFGMG